MVGDDIASKVYVRNKNKACEEIGIEYEDRSIESYLEPMLIEFHGSFPTT